MTRRGTARLVLAMTAGAALAAAPPALGKGVDEPAFAYERGLAASATGPVAFEPDGPMFAHAAPRFRDLRVLDAEGAQVPWRTATRRKRVERKLADVDRREEGTRTVVEVDLGYANVPVDQLLVRATNRRYDRDLSAFGSTNGKRYLPVGAARITRFPGSSKAASVPVDSRFRHLRIVVENGDDRPLASIDVRARSRSYALVAEGGHSLPYRLLYGNPGARAPSYDFARLPPIVVGAGATQPGLLGGEDRNAEFEAAPPPDDRSFAEKNPWVVTGALLLAALALGGAGILALRRPSSSASSSSP